MYLYQLVNHLACLVGLADYLLVLTAILYPVVQGKNLSEKIFKFVLCVQSLPFREIRVSSRPSLLSGCKEHKYGTVVFKREKCF